MQTFDGDEYKITTLRNLFEIIEDRHYSTPDYPNPWLFRGHSNHHHNLLPGIGRLLGSPRFKDEAALLKFEKMAFIQFETAVYPELKEQNQFIILAVAHIMG